MNKLALALFGILLMSFSTSCDQEDDYVIDAVLITVFDAPFRMDLNSTTEIRVVATANNGCWSNIEIQQDELREFHFQLRAEGRKNNSQVCNSALVTEEKIIRFIAEKVGTYYFHVNAPPFEESLYTIVVE